MFAYARHAGLGELAAFVAGVGYMLSPRWMLQLFVAGHTVTQGICWLPLVLLCVERAIIRRSWSWAVGGGMAYAMLILGTHPQWTFYGSLLIGFWPLRLLSPPSLLGKGRLGAIGEPDPQAKGSATPSLALQAPKLATASGGVSRRRSLAASGHGASGTALLRQLTPPAEPRRIRARQFLRRLTPPEKPRRIRAGISSGG